MTTPEAHHTRLMDEIDYELDTYGPSSLADMIATMAEARRETDDSKQAEYLAQHPTAF